MIFQKSLSSFLLFSDFELRIVRTDCELCETNLIYGAIVAAVMESMPNNHSSKHHGAASITKHNTQNTNHEQDLNTSKGADNQKVKVERVPSKGSRRTSLVREGSQNPNEGVGKVQY